MVDGFPYKEEVGGSSPSVPTTSNLKFWISDLKRDSECRNLSAADAQIDNRVDAES